MRRTLVTALAALPLVLSIPMTCAAGGGGIGWGLKAGLSAAHLSGYGPGFGNGNLYSFGGGAHVDVPLSGAIGLRTEVLYLTKGASVRLGLDDVVPVGSSAYAQPHALYAIEYLEIPVLMRLRGSSARAVRPELVAGPALAVKLHSRIKNPYTSSSSIDLGGVRSTDVGMALGAGVVVGRGRARWSLESRYTAGLSSIWELPGYSRQRNETAVILTGVSF